jgi:hypothetical protein
MGIDHEDRLDADVPELALRALDEASRRAAEAGRTQVVVRGNQLVRISPAGVEVLKELPPRPRSPVRQKVIRP